MDQPHDVMRRCNIGMKVENIDIITLASWFELQPMSGFLKSDMSSRPLNSPSFYSQAPHLHMEARTNGDVFRMAKVIPNQLSLFK
jgi:hypothetical protein